MLDDDAIARYARQIVIPGVGAAGQQKLLASTVLVAGDPRGRDQAALYLRAAGVRVVLWPGPAGSAIDLAIVADTHALDESARRELLELGKPVCWYTTDATGFTSGVHPGLPLPADDEGAPAPSSCPPELHDAAACDAASVACAILVGLPWRSVPFRFDC